MDKSQVIDAESRPLAIREEYEPQANVALFGTSDPVDVIAQATRVADALKSVVVKKKLVSVIQGKEYPQVEAWQTLAVMLGLAAVCEWTRQVEGGWEARVIVQRNGQTIAAAEAQCLRTERTKKGWEDYAIRSMAQTRATSKSLRSVLGFVMVLAGYQATPAEEMPADTTPPPPPDESKNEKVRESGRKAVMAYATEHKIPDEHRHEIAQAIYGRPSTKQLDSDELRGLYRLQTRYVKSRDDVTADGKCEWDGEAFNGWLEIQVRESKSA